MLQLAYLCLWSYFFHVFLHAGRIGAGLGLLIIFHQVWLMTWYEGHLKGSWVGRALHNLLDIVLPYNSCQALDLLSQSTSWD